MEVEAKPTTSATKRALAVLLIGGPVTLAVAFGINHFFDLRPEPDDGLKPYAVNLPRLSVQTYRETAYREQSTGLCDGDETICTTLISSTPSESLQSLIAAIPKGDAKRYKIRLAVVPIEEFDETLPEVHGEPVLKPLPSDNH